MISDLLNAACAFFKSDENNQPFKRCVNKIHTAINDGNFETDCSSKLTDMDREKLSNLGYTVSLRERGGDYSVNYKRWYNVSWYQPNRNWNCERNIHTE
jgi:hypothetical protein